MKTMLATLCVGLWLAGGAWAGDRIEGKQQEMIQAAMSQHITDMVERNGNGKCPVFDPALHTIVQVEFKKLHKGVERMGDKTPYFVSCADVVAGDGTRYDLDLVVSKTHGVVATIVQAKNGVASTYDVPYRNRGIT